MIKKLRRLINHYRLTWDTDPENAIAVITADLRHLCDEFGVDYGHADALGYSWYCEENGQKQKE